LVINPINYAEVSIRYSRIEDLNDALQPALVAREAIRTRPHSAPGRLFSFTGGIAGQGHLRCQTSSSALTPRSLDIAY
jgi:hypothetical protein